MQIFDNFSFNFYSCVVSLRHLDVNRLVHTSAEADEHNGIWDMHVVFGMFILHARVYTVNRLLFLINRNG